MRISKKLSAFIVMLFLGVMATQVVAQPSIPRRNGSRTSSSYARRGTWGTQYDWLGQRYATWNDIRYKDAGQIRVLKNSIYARHGYIFKDANLRAYFNSQRWYYGYRNSVPTSEFNAYERANINFLKKYDH